MIVHAVDPRDTEWEIDDPTYRVYFWEPSSGQPDAAWSSSEWEVSEADVHEVIAWAQAEAAGRRVTMWVKAARDDGPGLIRLAGWEPTRSEHAPFWAHA